ncbi:MAG TPA: DUF6088 family protein [Treponemataceae bacterium]|nr:DUF6088 family protein [Treponemataceae bacterium]
MVTEQVINRIYGKKRGWCFTPKDFLDLGSQEAVWQTLSRLVEKGLIRKVLRGVYEYPVKSRIQEGYVSPSPDTVAQAIARTNGWTILPDENTAMTILGLTTQISARWIYLTDGPNKKYSMDTLTIEFKRAPLRETSKLSRNSAILVHGIKGLGMDHINDESLNKLAAYLPPSGWKKTIQECRIVNGWVLETIKKAAAISCSMEAGND